MLIGLLHQALPLRTQGLHICFPARKSVTTLVLPALLWLLGASLRQRLRCHYGYPSELKQALSEYLIGAECLPEAFGGTFAKWDQWVRERRTA